MLECLWGLGGSVVFYVFGFAAGALFEARFMPFGDGGHYYILGMRSVPFAIILALVGFFVGIRARRNKASWFGWGAVATAVAWPVASACMFTYIFAHPGEASELGAAFVAVACVAMGSNVGCVAFGVGAIAYFLMSWFRRGSAPER
jgi:uncharacterized BrkB/YihY/UPF0761 family membrane protein